MDLSVIIPVYNGANFITGIVEDINIQNQDRISYEILLIDDGSIDNTSFVLYVKNLQVIMEMFIIIGKIMEELLRQEITDLI